MIRLAAVFTVSFIVIACSSFPDQVPAPEEEKKDQNGTTPSGGAQLPPSSTPKSGATPSSSDASTPNETSPPSSTDGGSTSDASTSKPDASGNDASAPVKIGFGQPCTTHTQCADGLCLPFDGKGMRCTKTCKDDDDCPSDDCDGNDVKICDVD